MKPAAVAGGLVNRIRERTIGLCMAMSRMRSTLVPVPAGENGKYPPKHPPVWVRIEGAWREGVILYWVTTDPAGYGWECQIETDVPGTGRRTARYMYDEQTIRPRLSSDPPSAEAAPQVPVTRTEAP
jgi:hypothetical protein